MPHDQSTSQTTAVGHGHAGGQATPTVVSVALPISSVKHGHGSERTLTETITPLRELREQVLVQDVFASLKLAGPHGAIAEDVGTEHAQADVQNSDASVCSQFRVAFLEGEPFVPMDPDSTPNTAARCNCAVDSNGSGRYRCRSCTYHLLLLLFFISEIHDG